MRRIPSWIWGLLCAVLTTEAASLGALWVLHWRTGLDYEPLRTSLSASHREQLTKLLNGTLTYDCHHPTLGWSVKPNGATELYRTNAQGIRADREFAPQPPPGVLRLAAFGDSFTKSAEVANADTWEAILERLDPRLEVLNFGVGGYGLDQAYLRYRQDGAPFHPHRVFIGLIPDNINRHVNVFRPFLNDDTGMPMAKPRFTLRDGELVLLPNPLPDLADYERLLADEQIFLKRLGAHDYFYQRRAHRSSWDASASVRLAKLFLEQWRMHAAHDAILRERRFNARSEAHRITEQLCDVFYDEVQAQGAVPIIVIFPQRTDVLAYRTTGGFRYTVLLEHLQERGLRHINMAAVFGQEPWRRYDRELFMPMGHLSPLGNEAVARTVLAYLQQERWLAPTAGGAGAPAP